MSGLIGQVGARSGVVGTTELDYEEGTFSFSIATTSGTANLHSSHDTGTYVKIGSMVHIQGNLGLTSGSSGTGKLKLTLPFVSGNFDDESESCGGGLAMYSVDWDGSAPAWELPGGGSTYVSFQTSQDDAGWGNLNFNNSDYYIFSIQYRTG